MGIQDIEEPSRHHVVLTIRLSRMSDFIVMLGIFDILLCRLLASLFGHIPRYVIFPFISMTENHSPERFITAPIFTIIATTFFLAQWLLYKRRMRESSDNKVFFSFLLLLALLYLELVLQM